MARPNFNIKGGATSGEDQSDAPPPLELGLDDLPSEEHNFDEFEEIPEEQWTDKDVLSTDSELKMILKDGKFFPNLFINGLDPKKKVVWVRSTENRNASKGYPRGLKQIRKLWKKTENDNNSSGVGAVDSSEIASLARSVRGLNDRLLRVEQSAPGIEDSQLDVFGADIRALQFRMDAIEAELQAVAHVMRKMKELIVGGGESEYDDQY
jgi:hypothetical protein